MTGFGSAIVRIVLWVVIGLISLLGMTESPLPAWFERYTQLDTGSKSFNAMVMQTIYHNNPIVNVFVWELMDIAGLGPDASKSSAYSPGPKTTEELQKLRLRNRWQVAYTLVRNPIVRAERAGTYINVVKAEVADSTATKQQAGQDVAVHTIASVTSRPWLPHLAAHETTASQQGRQFSHQLSRSLFQVNNSWVIYLHVTHPLAHTPPLASVISQFSIRPHPASSGPESRRVTDPHARTHTYLRGYWLVTFDSVCRRGDYLPVHSVCTSALGVVPPARTAPTAEIDE